MPRWQLDPTTGEPAIDPATGEPISDEKSLGGFGQNVLTSAARAGQGVIALARLASPDAPRALAEAITHPTNVWKGVTAIGSSLLDRAKAYQHPLDLAYHDPVGVAMDLASLLSGAGGAARVMGAETVGRTALRAGDVLNPLGTALTALAKGGQSALGPLAERMMGGATQPRELLTEFPNLLKTQLTERIPIGTAPGLGAMSPRGSQQAALKLQALAADRTALLRGSEATVNPETLAEALGPVAQRFAENPTADRELAALERYREEFLRRRSSPVMAPQTTEQASPILDAAGQPMQTVHSDLMEVGREPSPLSMEEEQRLKTKAQARADRAYRTQEKGGVINQAESAADMAIAQAARQNLEANLPAIGPLNARAQGLLGVKQAVGRAERRELSRPMISLWRDAPALAAVSGGTMYGHPYEGALVGALLESLLRPNIASRLAIGLNQTAPAILSMPALQRAALLARLMASHDASQSAGPP